MDSRLIALKHLQGKQDLLEEFAGFYEKTMQDLGEQRDWESLRAAREILHQQLDYVTDLALSCEGARGG